MRCSAQNTGHRIKYRKVMKVDSADIIKGYEVGKGEYIELDPEETPNLIKQAKNAQIIFSPDAEIIGLLIR